MIIWKQKRFMSKFAPMFYLQSNNRQVRRNFTNHELVTSATPFTFNDEITAFPTTEAIRRYGVQRTYWLLREEIIEETFALPSYIEQALNDALGQHGAEAR